LIEALQSIEVYLKRTIVEHVVIITIVDQHEYVDRFIHQGLTRMRVDSETINQISEINQNN
jgi:hypothetical protein